MQSSAGEVLGVVTNDIVGIVCRPGQGPFFRSIKLSYCPNIVLLCKDSAVQVCTCCASVCVQVLELGSAYRRSPSSWKCLDLTDKYQKDRRCRTGKPSPVTIMIALKFEY